jgi:hypothetical protein
VLQSERLANGLFDIVQTNDRAVGTDDVTDGAGGFLGAQFATEHTVFGYEAKHDALEDPRVGPALLGDPAQYVLVDAQGVLRTESAEQRAPCLRIHRFDRTDHAPREPRMEVIAEPIELMQSAVGNQNDLAGFTQQHIDRVAQFDQRAGFPQTELNIVDDQDLDIAVLLAEAGKAS